MCGINKKVKCAVAERGALPMSGRPGGPGGDWKGFTSLNGRVEAAGTAGGQCSLLEGQGHQDLPKEKQSAQFTGGKTEIEQYVS